MAKKPKISEMQLHLSFDRAFVFIPKGFRGIDESISGALQDVRKNIPPASSSLGVLPVVVFLPGSSDRGVERKVAEQLCEQQGIGLIALNTHAIPERPSYDSPADQSTYNLIHALRLAELKQFLQRKGELDWIDSDRMILMGLSEGAVAAATCKDRQFDIRILLAWPCETTYFADADTIGADKDAHILNIIGFRDEYFGPDSPLRAGRNIQGHGGRTLAGHPNSKVVILPHYGHRLLEGAPFVFAEIQQFISIWLETKTHRGGQAS